MAVLNLLASQFMNGCAHCFLCLLSLLSFSLSHCVLRRRVHYHQYVVLMNQPSSSGSGERTVPPPLAQYFIPRASARALWVTRLQRHTELYCIVHWGGTKPIWITICVGGKQRKNDEREKDVDDADDDAVM